MLTLRVNPVRPGTHLVRQAVAVVSGSLRALLRLAAPYGPAWGGAPAPPRGPQFDEAALIAAAQRGHLPAFNQLILHYQNIAYNVAQNAGRPGRGC
jgi:hypothetical protein